MSTIIQAIRGMNDILPDETKYWQQVETILKTVLQRYGYDEIRFPIVEKTELFKRSIGEATDIVEKEMYTFLDRNQDSLTLRPEGTAVCIRAGIEHGLFHNQIQRLWYLGPYFRHERPQKGRYRQFHQCGAEVIGLPGPDVDAELISLSAKILEQLGLKPYVKLELNSLGNPASRAAYRTLLVEYFSTHSDLLDDDSKKRLLTNPLRILDSKNPQLRDLIKHAPTLSQHLDDESNAHFTGLCSHLEALGIPYEINPCLVRGLDYYTKTVFEWTTQALGAQGTVCAGGRYDGLIEQLGGKATPALGFGMGLERIILLMQAVNARPLKTPPSLYFVCDEGSAFQSALKIADSLRDHGWRVTVHCGGGSFKNQLKRADKSGALYALILGEEEQRNSTVTLKSLRDGAPQEILAQNELLAHLDTKLST